MHGVVIDCLTSGAVALPIVVGAILGALAFARAGRELARMRRLKRTTPARMAAIISGEARGRVVVRGRARRIADGEAARRAGLLVDEWGRLPPLAFAIDDGTGAVEIDLGAALFDDTMPRGRALWDGDEIVLEADVDRADATYRQAQMVRLRPAGARSVVVGRDDRWSGPLAGAAAQALVWPVVVILGEAVLGGFVVAILSAVG